MQHVNYTDARQNLASLSRGFSLSAPHTFRKATILINQVHPTEGVTNVFRESGLPC